MESLVSFASEHRDELPLFSRFAVLNEACFAGLADTRLGLWEVAHTPLSRKTCHRSRARIEVDPVPRTVQIPFSCAAIFLEVCRGCIHGTWGSTLLLPPPM